MEIAAIFLEKWWLRYKSIPIVFLIVVIISTLQIPGDGNSLGVRFYTVTACLLICVIIYSIATINSNTLASAGENETGVLFVIESENSKTYEHIRHCLVSKFEELSRNYSKLNMRVICIPKSIANKYTLSKSENFQKILLRTNCLFAVYTRYTVDDVDASENFEMCIDYALLHPKIKKEVRNLLLEEMHMFCTSIHRQTFQKHDTIQTFNVTAQMLSYICEYFLGISFILTNRLSTAKEIFIQLDDVIKKTELNNHFIRVLVPIIKKRLVEICFALARPAYNSYRQTKKPEYLMEYRCLLEEANKYTPNTYEYYLDSAMLAILIDRDPGQAAIYVEKCKLTKSRNEWRYSDAFLAAYDIEMNPLKIYRKYQTAFKYEINILDIAEFIEDIIEEEPEHGGLHLALGLIYHDIKDSELMHIHFEKYRIWFQQKEWISGIFDIIDKYEHEFLCETV